MKDFVECVICHEKFGQLNAGHLKFHGILNTAQYKKLYPNAPVVSEKRSNSLSTSVKKTLKNRYKNMTKKEKRNCIKNARIVSRKSSVRKQAGKSLSKRIKNDPVVKEKWSKRMRGSKNIIYNPGVVEKIVATKKRNRSLGILTKMDTKEYRQKQRLNTINRNAANPYKRFTNTKPEIEMKAILKELGIKYKHNYPIRNILHSYCADFYVPKTNMVIEVDGKFFHNYPYGTEKDATRNKEMKEAGYFVLRFWDEEFDTEKVREAIYNG